MRFPNNSCFFFLLLLYINYQFEKINVILCSICRITAKIDDEMLKYYCNEDIFLLEVRHSKDDMLDIFLIELMDN